MKKKDLTNLQMCIMKRLIISTFNCFMASAELERVTLDDFRTEYFVLTTWTRIKDKTHASNFNMTPFECELYAKSAYAEFVKNWL